MVKNEKRLKKKIPTAFCNQRRYHLAKESELANPTSYPQSTFIRLWWNLGSFRKRATWQDSSCQLPSSQFKLKRPLHWEAPQ